MFHNNRSNFYKKVTIILLESNKDKVKQKRKKTSHKNPKHWEIIEKDRNEAIFFKVDEIRDINIFKTIISSQESIQ